MIKPVIVARNQFKDIALSDVFVNTIYFTVYKLLVADLVNEMKMMYSKHGTSTSSNRDNNNNNSIITIIIIIIIIIINKMLY